MISNASVWNTMQLLPSGAVSEVEKVEKMATPMTGSFVHLHLGMLMLYYCTEIVVILIILKAMYFIKYSIECYIYSALIHHIGSLIFICII